MTAPPIPLLIWTLPLVVGIGFLRGLAEGTFFFIVPDVFLTLFARVVRTAGSGGCCWYGQVSMRSLSSAWAGESFPGGGRQLGQQAGQALLEEAHESPAIPVPGQGFAHHHITAEGHQEGHAAVQTAQGLRLAAGYPPGTGSRSAPFPGPERSPGADREDRQHPAGEPGEQALAEEIVGRRVRAQVWGASLPGRSREGSSRSTSTPRGGRQRSREFS